jgi:hypothetical protein
MEISYNITHAQGYQGDLKTLENLKSLSMAKIEKALKI